jgi:GlpG protein
MRKIGQLEDEDRSELFSAYLFVHGIDARTETIEPPPPGRPFWQIWVLDEDRVDEAKALFSRFLSMPDAEEFQKSAAAAAAERLRRSREEAETEPTAARAAWLSRMSAGTAAGDAGVWPMGGVCGIVLVLVAVLYLMMGLGPVQPWIRELLFSSEGLRHGQVWRLFTPVLLHADIWAVLFDLLWWMDLGRGLEARIGSRRFLVFFLGLSAAGTLASWIAVPAGAGGVGLLGVVYGLFGYIWLRNRLDGTFGMPLPAVTGGLLLAFLALGAFGMMDPGTTAAVVSCLLLGALWGWLHSRRA